MTEQMDAPKSGASRKFSPIKNTAKFVVATVASLSLAHANPTEKPATTTQSAKTTAQVESLEAYRLKVAKMTEKELRAESDALSSKVQPLIDANASDKEVMPLMDLYDIVEARLGPIIDQNRVMQNAKLAELRAEGKRLDKEGGVLKKEGKQLDFALKVFTDLKAKLEAPEQVEDWEATLKEFKLALQIHKKHNPDLYAAHKQLTPSKPAK